MTTSGMLRIEARFAPACISDIRVILSRPKVSRLFIGQNPEAVVKTVPYLYTLCAHAQRAAAQAALVAAGGVTARPVDDRELWMEVLHEHFWRLLLDWPPALGLAPAQAAFIEWRGKRLGDDCLAATENLLFKVLQPLAEKCQEILVDRQESPGFDFSGLTPQDWLAYWRGEQATQPASRRPASVARAYQGRVREVAQAFAAFRAGAPFPVAAAGQDGWGVGQTLTARGVLTHAAHVEEGIVKNYRVWAPTDCHFADAEGVQQLLSGVPVPDVGQARQAMERAVLALDPCLPYVLEFADA